MKYLGYLGLAFSCLALGLLLSVFGAILVAVLLTPGVGTYIAEAFALMQDALSVLVPVYVYTVGAFIAVVLFVCRFASFREKYESDPYNRAIVGRKSLNESEQQP